MIPVLPQEQPPEFERAVRAPGQAFLRTNRQPKSADFARHDYWRRVMPQMKSKYASTCAYSSMPVMGDASIDHFQPKVIFPLQAYVWSNYRLCLASLNGKKGDDQTILDPFTIQPGWFHLDLATLFVLANPNAPQVIQPRIRRTIDVLTLNSTALVTLRFNIYSAYMRNRDMVFLNDFYPFIAAEVSRQTHVQPKGLDEIVVAEAGDPILPLVE